LATVALPVRLANRQATLTLFECVSLSDPGPQLPLVVDPAWLR